MLEPVSDQAKLFISQLLAKDPAKRMTASEAMKHTWLNDFQHLTYNHVKPRVQHAKELNLNELNHRLRRCAQSCVSLLAYLCAVLQDWGHVFLTCLHSLPTHHIGVVFCRFIGMNKLKRVALNVIAQQLSNTQIGYVKEVFVFVGAAVSHDEHDC